MKLRVNAGELVRRIKPAADIALRHVKKNESNEPFHYAGMLTIEASPHTLCIRAYGGTASIIVSIDETDGYVPDGNGAVSVRASEVMDCLKSFQPTDNLIVSAQGEQMTLALESDPDTFIGLPASHDLIKCPPISSTSEQESVVGRACFVKGMQAVAYAMAVEDKMFAYKCVLFESWKNTMSFTAGSGGRFARLAIDGDTHQISENETMILFPKPNVPNVIRIFKDSSKPTVRIRTIEQDPRNNICEQIVLEDGNITLALYGMETLSKYPKLTTIFNYAYSYRIPTRIRDWKPVVEAIKASYRYNESNIHNTEVVADLLHGHFDVRTNSKMQISRKVGFEFGAYVADCSKDKNHKPWFRCNSTYILEMVQKGYKDGTVVLNFDDQALLDNIPADKPKQMRPVLITYPSKTNKDGTREKFSVFFTVSTKW